MMDYHVEDGSRQTGRTTRMLQEVLAVQKRNPEMPITVLSANHGQSQDMQFRFAQMGGHVPVVRWLSNTSSSSSLQGIKGVIFKDHYAIESLLNASANTIAQQDLAIQNMRDQLIQRERQIAILQEGANEKEEWIEKATMYKTLLSQLANMVFVSPDSIIKNMVEKYGKR